MEPYSNREIEAFMKRQEETHKNFGETLERIEEKVTYTNGKVGDIQKWRERWTGASYVILIVVIPIMSWALYQISNIDQKIRDGVQMVLNNYNVEIK